MDIVIKEVRNQKDLKTFVKVPFGILRGSPNWVPPLIHDEMETFDPKKNPAYENADSRLFIAYRNNLPVGRIAAILSRAANRKYGTRNLRFGWLDAIEEESVFRALLGAVEAWAGELGMETITGPHGFVDFDPNGMLVEGFDKLCTQSGNYNPPYYPAMVEKCGFRKEIDYVEFLTTIPTRMGIPAKLLNLADRVMERGKFRLIDFRNKKHLMQRAPELFHLLDETFEEIYGTVPLTPRQIDYYVKKYIPYIDKELIKVVVNEKDEMIGFMITMPSLSRALQKSGGKLFPFGWIPIMRALRHNDVVEFMLAGVRKSYRGQGVDLLMVIELGKTLHKKGFRVAESNQELETNTKIQAQWKYFNPVQHKRRRIFKKQIVCP
jgi:hypothetical protein